ncbi:hypothetical protein [Fimbriiglobus ruber]|uniref:Uncharacterized protein n=1 Tax=Fimbriiglobus ruber TaxID=1908690 RepID=A0A225E054_9BACT|nr:hypothetical protein [Fimbriiglobus ruber]OWK46922.1 hypothetical protein FRUB_00621 [Fimbriiglobus ruber]
MSMMLNFYHSSWARARELATSGHRADALAALAPLLQTPAGPDVPQRLVLLAHRLAARLYAAAEQYRKARRFLYAAEKLDATGAEIQYELGTAFENDPYGCDRRAARRFRRAVSLGSGNAKYLAALGRALVRINRVGSGVKHLRAAAATVGADADVLRVVVDGLCDAGRAALAWKVITKALFLAPGNKALRQLSEEVRYALALARVGQDQTRTQRRPGPAGPHLLPFIRVYSGEAATGGATVRMDAGSRPFPHIGRVRAYRAGRGG